jgi:ABC-2 type transport system ATP-binding protein
MSSAIRCEGLVKRYGTFVALDGLNLDVPSGAIFGFLGPNGAGKTTTVRLLTGLGQPTAGRATVAGVNVVQGDNALRARIGYLDQQPQFYGWMTGRELLQFVGELFGMRGAALNQRVDEMLALTGLSDAARRKVGGYSGGMRQRLGLAQALISKPEVLFLDEPVSALDPAGRRDVLDLIAGLRGQTTVFMSTHILGDIERVCDKVAIINKGKLIAESTVPALQAQYAQPIYVLDPEANQEALVAQLITQLQAQPWIISAALDHGIIRVIVNDPATASHAILPLVAAANVALVRFERARPSLEDIFLRLVGDDCGMASTESGELQPAALATEVQS